MSRHERIARELERLPRELHEPVLRDLRVIDLLEIAVYAGPGLMSSIEVSPSGRPLWGANGSGFSEFCTLVRETWGILNKFPWLKRAFLKHRYYQESWALHWRVAEWLRQNGTTYSGILKVTPTQLSKLQAPGVRVFQIIEKDIRRFVCVEPSARMGPLKEGTLLRYYEAYGNTPSPAITPSLHDGDWESWTMEQMDAHVSRYFDAQRLWNKLKSDQLLQLARLNERFPEYVRAVLAPQEPRKNAHHTTTVLRRWSTTELRAETRARAFARGDSAFFYVHPYLVPHNWTLRLWARAAELHPDKVAPIPDVHATEDSIRSASMTDVPPEIEQAIVTARLGMRTYFVDCTQCVEAPPPNMEFPVCKQCGRFAPFSNTSRLTQPLAKGQVSVFRASTYLRLRQISLEQLYANEPEEGKDVRGLADRKALEAKFQIQLSRRRYRHYRSMQKVEDQRVEGTVSLACAPTDRRELQWLEAYLTVVEWAQKRLGVTLDDDENADSRKGDTVTTSG